MKTILSILFFFLIIFQSFSQTALPSAHWPKNEVAFDLSTNLLNIHVSGMVERSFHPKPGFHWGIAGGLVWAPIMPSSGFASPTEGAIFSSSLWTGKNSNHFEMRLGVAVIDLLNEHYTGLFPIFYFGYRRQKPDSPTFFRTYLGSVGIGFGVGRVWGR